jgi:hypothetical protein
LYGSPDLHRLEFAGSGGFYDLRLKRLLRWMMAAGHSAVVVKVERIGNAAIAFHGRCCGDAKSDTPHTVYLQGANADLSDADLDAMVNSHLREVENRHAVAARIEAALAKYAAPVPAPPAAAPAKPGHGGTK